MDFKDLVEHIGRQPQENDNSTEAQARRAGIKLIDESSEIWKTLNSLQQFGARSAQDAILRASTNHAIAPLHFKGKVMDFGCGVGGSTYFLSYNGAVVDAIDLTGSSLEELRRLKLPSVQIIENDGLQVMQKTPNETYDMVCAFMLGPDEKGDFIEAFYNQANRIITANGRILVTSDGNTFSVLQNKYSGNYGNSLHQSNIFIGRKNPQI